MLNRIHKNRLKELYLALLIISITLLVGCKDNSNRYSFDYIEHDLVLVGDRTTGESWVCPKEETKEETKCDPMVVPK